VLPQVLAGLGLTLISAGCEIWLQRLQPLFFTVAVAALGYQVWLIRFRPPKGKRVLVKMVLALSIFCNFIVIGGWVALLIRYR
jgi:uncharacterized membrane protein YadS